MNKVLFTHSYFYYFDPKQWRSGQYYPPLATIQAAAVVRRNGFDTKLHDTNLLEHPDKIEQAIDVFRPKYVVIYDDGFNYLTKMCLTNMRDAAFRMAQIASGKGCTVIINSSDSTDHYESYLDQGVSFVVRGEGEETLTELLLHLENGKSPETITGIAWRKDGKTIVNPQRPVMRDLDDLPIPAWDLVDVNSYKKIWKERHGYFSLNLATTRGCPFKCNWCAKPIYGNRYNSRSPEHVVNEIEYLVKTHGVDHFWMCDDIFGLKPGWIAEFNELVQARKLKFKYKIQSRVDLLLEADTVRELAESGAETVWVGAESGSQQVLDAMDKGTTVEQIRKASQMLKHEHIEVGFFLQFGYPGESWKDIQATLQMVTEIMPDHIGISVSYPLPGTKFFETVKGQLKSKQNWTDSDDLSMMFAGTYPPEFYKILHRYVHDKYAVRRGVLSFSLRRFASMIYHAPLSWIRSYQLKRIRLTHVPS